MVTNNKKHIIKISITAIVTIVLLAAMVLFAVFLGGCTMVVPDYPHIPDYPPVPPIERPDPPITNPGEPNVELPRLSMPSAVGILDSAYLVWNAGRTGTFRVYARREGSDSFGHVGNTNSGMLDLDVVAVNMTAIRIVEQGDGIVFRDSLPRDITIERISTGNAPSNIRVIGSALHWHQWSAGRYRLYTRSQDLLDYEYFRTVTVPQLAIGDIITRDTVGLRIVSLHTTSNINPITAAFYDGSIVFSGGSPHARLSINTAADAALPTPNNFRLSTTLTDYIEWDNGATQGQVGAYNRIEIRREGEDNYELWTDRTWSNLRISTIPDDAVGLRVRVGRNNNATLTGNTLNILSGQSPFGALGIIRDNDKARSPAPNNFAVSGEWLVWNNGRVSNYSVYVRLEGNTLYTVHRDSIWPDLLMSAIPNDAVSIKVIEHGTNIHSTSIVDDTLVIGTANQSHPATITIQRPDGATVPVPSNLRIDSNGRLAWGAFGATGAFRVEARLGAGSDYIFLAMSNQANLLLSDIPDNAIGIRIMEVKHETPTLVGNVLTIASGMSLPAYLEIDRAAAKTVPMPSNFRVSGGWLDWDSNVFGTVAFRIYTRNNAADYVFWQLQNFPELHTGSIPTAATGIKIVTNAFAGSTVSGNILSLGSGVSMPAHLNIDRSGSDLPVPSNFVVAGNTLEWNNRRSGSYRIYTRTEGQTLYELLTTRSWGEIGISNIPSNAVSLRVIETAAAGVSIYNNTLQFGAGTSAPASIGLNRQDTVSLSPVTNVRIVLWGGSTYEVQWDPSGNVYYRRYGETQYRLLRSNSWWLDVRYIPRNAVSLRIIRQTSVTATLSGGVLTIGRQVSAPYTLSVSRVTNTMAAAAPSNFRLNSWEDEILWDGVGSASYRLYVQREGRPDFDFLMTRHSRWVRLSAIEDDVVLLKVVANNISITPTIHNGILAITDVAGFLDISQGVGEIPAPHSFGVSSGNTIAWTGAGVGTYRLYVLREDAATYQFLTTRNVAWVPLSTVIAGGNVTRLKVIALRPYGTPSIVGGVLTIISGESAPGFLDITQTTDSGNIAAPHNFRIGDWDDSLMWDGTASTYRVYVLLDGEPEFEFLRTVGWRNIWFDDLWQTQAGGPIREIVQIKVIAVGQQSASISGGVLNIGSGSSQPVLIDLGLQECSTLSAPVFSRVSVNDGWHEEHWLVWDFDMATIGQRSFMVFALVDGEPDYWLAGVGAHFFGTSLDILDDDADYNIISIKVMSVNKSVTNINGTYSMTIYRSPPSSISRNEMLELPVIPIEV